MRVGAVAVTMAWIRSAIARSAACILAIASSTSRSPSALLLFARSSAFSSLARALIAARSSTVNPLADFVFASAIAHLLNADQIAGGIADGTVANPVRLVGRLLDDFRVPGLHPLERAVEVGGGQVDACEGPFRHHLGDCPTLLVRDAGSR